MTSYEFQIYDTTDRLFVQLSYGEGDEMRLNRDCCTGCGYCLLVCPHDALGNDGWAFLRPERCTDCNACLYACPNGCFTPDRPPRRRARNYGDGYDALIIGAGLGGLMTAAALARQGWQVALFEQLGFPGGRYTEIRYHGYQITTGAWTPLGPRSNIGRFLAEVGAQVRWITLRDRAVGGRVPDLFHIAFADGRYYRRFDEFLTSREMRAYARALAMGRRPGAEGISIHDHLARWVPNPDLLAVADANVCTASGLRATQVPASEYTVIVQETRAVGADFGFPIGGPRAIVQALLQVVRKAGGRLFTRSPVTRILLEDGRAVGVQLATGEQVRATRVIHNGGPARLRRLVGEENLPADYRARLRGLKDVPCGALVLGLREPLFPEVPMLLTPGAQRVVGIFAPTFFDPTLAPPDRHQVDVFFPLESEDRRAELARVWEDLRTLFPRLDALVEVAVPMLFTGGWTGAESGQYVGQTGEARLSPQTPIEGLYLVGMDLQGSAVAGDIVPLGVRRLLEVLA